MESQVRCPEIKSPDFITILSSPDFIILSGIQFTRHFIEFVFVETGETIGW